MACTTGCPTQTCDSYSACLRNKGARVAYANSAGGMDYTAQKKWDKNLADYKDARAQGIQPAGTDPAKVRRAVEISDLTGKAYQA